MDTVEFSASCLIPGWVSRSTYEEEQVLDKNLHLGYKCNQLAQTFLWYVIRILLKIPQVARQISRKKPPHFILKIPNCGNVGSKSPPRQLRIYAVVSWQFGSGKLTPCMNVTTAPILSSGIHLPVTVSIYVRSPSRSLRPSDRPPLKPPPASQLFISPR